MKYGLLAALLIALVTGPVNAVAGGVFIKQGGHIVFKSECVAPHLERIAGAMQDLPDGEYSMAEMFLALAARADTLFPPLTDKESILCGTNIINLPSWKVAKNGLKIDRPASRLDANNVRNTTNIRVKVGTPCGSQYIESTSGGKEWRDVGHPLVAVCALY